MWKKIKQLFRRERLKPVRVISEQELGAMFLNAPNSPVWEATLATLDLQVQESLNDSLDEGLSNEQLRFRIGGVNELLKFKAHLLEREQQARLTERQATDDTDEH